MAGQLTGPARREKAAQAYKLAIRRVTFTEIATALDISRNLASTLVFEEQERQWEDRDLSELQEEKRRSIATYDEVIRNAWQRLGRIKDASLNVSGIYNAIISAQSKIDDITGAKAPVKTESDVNVTHREYEGAASEVRELDADIAQLREDIARAEAGVSPFGEGEA